MGTEPRRIPVGRIAGVYGVQGWVRIFSYTEPRAKVIEYGPWILRTAKGVEQRAVISGRAHGQGVVVALEGISDRDQAGTLIGAEIEVDRACFPAPAADEYYWTDLEGLKVCNPAGESLGVVDHLLETGANDVLVVRGERRQLIPFVMGRVVQSVDLDRGVITVDWSDDDSDEDAGAEDKAG